MTHPPNFSKEIHFANDTSIVSETIQLDNNGVLCGSGTMIDNGVCTVIRYFDCSYLEKIPIPEGSIREEKIVLYECYSPFDITQILE